MKKIFVAAACVSGVACSDVSASGRALSPAEVASVRAEIRYHRAQAEKLGVVNRFLATKHPLSAGNPEKHRAEAERLEKLLE